MEAGEDTGVEVAVMVAVVVDTSVVAGVAISEAVAGTLEEGEAATSVVGVVTLVAWEIISAVWEGATSEEEPSAVDTSMAVIPEASTVERCMAVSIAEPCGAAMSVVSTAESAATRASVV